MQKAGHDGTYTSNFSMGGDTNRRVLGLAESLQAQLQAQRETLSQNNKMEMTEQNTGHTHLASTRSSTCTYTQVNIQHVHKHIHK